MNQAVSSGVGALGVADGAVHWRVWAPHAASVELVWMTGEERCRYKMNHEEAGYFSQTLATIPEGQRCVYRLDGGPERPDPASRWQPDGVHEASAVLRPARFVWSDDTWTGVRREDLVFYELHVGTFTLTGTFDAIMPRLPVLRDLGVTALELMPIAQFPGTRNWGYDGVYPYAPHNGYGGPHGLQRLVDACHAAGLALFLDVVYNHCGPEGNYLQAFGPYFTEQYHTAWGRAINYDERGSDAVRAFVLDNVRLWIEDYHVDGLRLDAVHAIYDRSPYHILQAIKDTADATASRVGRQVHVVAESDLNDVRLLLPPERGGYGLDAQWSDDFHHVVHTCLTGKARAITPTMDAATMCHACLKKPSFTMAATARIGAAVTAPRARVWRATVSWSVSRTTIRSATALWVNGWGCSSSHRRSAWPRVSCCWRLICPCSSWERSMEKSIPSVFLLLCGRRSRGEYPPGAAPGVRGFSRPR